jgi:uncharacterized protein (TIGR02246 family)
MTNTLRILALSWGLCSAAQALAQSATAAGGGDDAAIRQIAVDYAAAWTAHDARAMAALWTDDGDLVNPLGKLAEGRRAVEKMFAIEHMTYMKATRLKTEVKSIKFVSDSVAVLDAEATLSGVRDPDGNLIQPQKHAFFAVLVKSGTSWAIASARLIVYVPPPPEGN